MVARAADRLPLLLLWHHHQPFYHAPEMERPVLPWVRLHAVRGYLDMVSLAQETGAAVTFNFSSSLLEQLRFAAQTTPADEFERISRIGAAGLSEREKRFILQYFFSINWAVHVKNHPRYAELLAQRGERVDESSLRRALMEFTSQDFTDLVALFNLSWIGPVGRRDGAISELLEKGRDFTQDDVNCVLDYHHRVLTAILPAYRSLRGGGQIEISTSPYAHAILPLLCDTRLAAPDVPRLRLPRPEYQHPEDAAYQLRLAAQLHAETWGVPACGLWPSEGSVSDDVLGLAAAGGFRWIATDQGILERSERTRTDGLAHFVSHVWQAGPQVVRLYFRDRALSDAIGFRYGMMPPRDCVREFIGHLEKIEQATREITGRCVVVALDGENPWEGYPDGGEGFLTGLYQELAGHARLTTSTFSDHMQAVTQARVHHIHPGSWIDSNFRIWIGDPEKNQGWLELGRARHVMDDLPAGDERREACRRWLVRAQASDWFWWYGEPFSSDFELYFDELFRSFLRAAYAAVGRHAPPGLNVPISMPPRVERRLQPALPMSPVLDGRETTFYEWVGSCRIDPRQYGAHMGRSEHFLRGLHYGFGDEDLFFRFDPSVALHPQLASVLTLHLLGHHQISVTIPLGTEKPKSEQDGVRWVAGKIVEVAVKHASLSLPRGGECQFWIEITTDGVLLEKLPPEGAYRFFLPTEDAVAANWMA